MSFVSSHRFAQPETNASQVQLPHEPRKRFGDFGDFGDFGADCQRELRRERRSDGPRDDGSAHYAASGGVATGTEVAERLRVEVSQPISLLARWIVDRQVLAFSCGAGLMLPLFQFDFAQGCIRSGVAPVMLELTGVMNDDELARWFAQPNRWLAGGAPAQTILIDAGAVLAAARVDRLGANGREPEAGAHAM